MKPAALVLPLASQAATLLLKIWLKNQPVASDAALGLSEVVKAASTDVFERRRLQRQFEQVADRIAAQLEPFVETEFADIPQNEVAAATRLAEEVLKSARISAATLAATDADPRRIEREARSAAQGLIESAYLSTSSEALFDLLLKEATDYVVDLAMGLPPFTSAAAQEMLRRETLLISRIDEILKRLPPASQFLGGSADGAAAAFEMEFRRAVSRRFDQLELFGLDLPEHRRYTLSVAYITLSVERAVREGVEGGDGEPLEAAETGSGTADGGYVSAIQALSEVSRALLTGEAGSGKTTLLQWLAVQACRGELAHDLHEWGNPIPFMIPLRRSVDTGLPAPEDFVAFSAPQLAGVMPVGWVHDQLSEGRALVLVDGVDELPPEKRDDVRRWLDDLVTTFPKSRFVVTSRPPAVEEGWLESQAFGSAELQPMSYTDIASFIQHWHDASLNGTEDDDEIEEVNSLARRLQELVRTDGAVRGLATSPLLCAMLCALHRDRKAQLPRGRLEVYRVALESLVERRDAEREVPHGLPAQSLSLPEKMVLLRDLAYWLQINGYTDAPLSKCVERVDAKLGSMPHLNYSGGEVFTYLLTRSGVLREPVPGRIDFLHRTFQEYLTAGEIIEQNNVGQLIASAHSDAWSGVVVLAAGQARREQREELMRGLIDRGKRDFGAWHRLHLLAIACLDASVELSPELTEEVQRILKRLIPPKTLTEANALASAGELAAPLLAARWTKEGARTTAACVRALGLIGGELSICTLTSMASDRRLTVGREIVRMWDEFDPDEYAERVLSHSPMFAGRRVWLPHDRAHLAVHLPELEGLRIGNRYYDRGDSEQELSLATWAKCETLKQLQVFGPLAAIDVAALPDYQELSELNLWQCGEIENVEGIGRAHLEKLSIDETTVPSLAFLAEAGELASLRLAGIGANVDLSLVRELSKLKDLAIEGPADLDGGQPLGGLELESLSLVETGLRSTESLADQVSLRSLLLTEPHARIDNVFMFRDLKRLTVTGSSVESLEVAAKHPLKMLTLVGAKRLKDVSGLRHLRDLIYLDLTGAEALTDFDIGDTCRSLKGLSLVGTGIDDIGSLANASNLTRLDLTNTLVRDFSPLAGLKNLRWVGVHDVFVKEVQDLLPDAYVRGFAFHVGPPQPYGQREIFPSPSAL